MTSNDRERLGRAARGAAREAGRVLMAARRAHAAAGEDPPRRRYVTPALTADGRVLVRVGDRPAGPGPLRIEPGDRIYQAEDDGSVLERTSPQPGVECLRRLHPGGDAELVSVTSHGALN